MVSLTTTIIMVSVTTTIIMRSVTTIIIIMVKIFSKILKIRKQKGPILSQVWRARVGKSQIFLKMKALI